MEQVPNKWSKGALFICEKCGRREDANPEAAGLAERWKAEFKSRLRDEGRGKEIRVMVSGCLGPCPPQKQTAAWFPTEGAPETVVVEPSEKEALFSWLKSR